MQAIHWPVWHVGLYTARSCTVDTLKLELNAGKSLKRIGDDVVSLLTTPLPCVVRLKLMLLRHFTARCCVSATLPRRVVRLPVWYCGHIGWNTSKTISRLINLESLLSPETRCTTHLKSVRRNEQMPAQSVSTVIYSGIARFACDSTAFLLSKVATCLYSTTHHCTTWHF